MASDLIPPSSPAGRPLPDGTPHLIELPPEPPRSPAEPSQRPAPGPSEFRNRFGFLMGALAGVFVAALLVVTAVLVTSGDSGSNEGLAVNWSKWKPTDTSLEGGAAQIAEKVGAEYKHPDGKQLVLVEGSPLPESYELVLHSSRITKLDGPTVVYQLD